MNHWAVAGASPWLSTRTRSIFFEQMVAVCPSPTGWGRLQPSASAEQPLGVGEAHGEFCVEGVRDSVEGGEAGDAGGDAASFESGNG